MIDFLSIYQQEINADANSMKCREMRKLQKYIPDNPLYSIDLLYFSFYLQNSRILSIPLFTRDCYSWSGMKKNTGVCFRKDKKGYRM